MWDKGFRALDGFLPCPYPALFDSLPEDVKVVSNQEHLVNTHPTTSTKERPTMKNNSRFWKTAAAAALVAASGGLTLGLTSLVSAEIQDPENPAIVAQESGETTSAATETPAVAAEDGVVVDGNVSGQAVTDTTVPAADGSTGDSPIVKRNSPVAVAAKALGMSEAELVTELQAGKSIADVAKDKNVDIDTVINALYADLKAHIDSEVAAGKHTQAEADAKLAEAKTRITEMVNKAGVPMHKGGPGKGGHGGREHGAPRFASENLAKSLGLTLEELNTQLKSGKTLAQIAEAQNVSTSALKDALTSDFKAHLDEEVKSGKHTQTEADAKLAEFTARLDDMINGVKPAGGAMGGIMGGRDGHGPRGMGGRGHHGMGDQQPAPSSSDAQGTSFSA